MTYSTEQFLRDRFLRDNGHLISPWKYSESQRTAMDGILLRLNWQRALPRYEYKTIKMGFAVMSDGSVVSPLPDGIYDSALERSMEIPADAK